MNADWLDDFQALEQFLLAHADWRTDRPAPMAIPADAPADPDKWQHFCAWLIERGWRIACDNVGEMWAYAPGPFTDPGVVARNLN